MVLSWIDGKPLKWSDEIPLKAARDKVLRQLASITFELLRCTAMEEDNSWTAEAFLVNLIDKRARRVLHEGVEGLDFQDCISLRVIARILSKMPNKFYLHENPPGCSYRTNFPVNLEKTAAISAISHDDLSAKNIIVDKDYNVKGRLINWTCAKQLPVRYAVRLPQLLGPDFKKPDPEDSWRGWEVVPPSEMLQKDREGFVDHLTWILLDEAPGSTISELAPLACDRDDIDWKHLAFLAVFMTNIHHKVVQKQFLMRKTMIWDALSPGTWERMLQQEMVSFYYDQLDMPEDMDNGEPSVRAAHPPVSLVTNDIC
ncbi:uncharacterized protein N7498_001752 [Penicillium cinerascens]|uniref:Aminoglycoside phosphotransferase domain-containing protein n=1 Tax=Penicillium cinerascens TaxID=70096 RepID=A0A9W9TBB3_9EURO|nr:uncharacterized protein N7498_001752 [Penicillium cinerascens]KAJ5215345.1 hypothetical protein N7498_001752 [Penicillium cinerascens]